MFRQLFRSLSTRLGLAVVLIEILLMLVFGLVYYQNFSYQVDERLEDRLKTASQIITDGGLNLTSLVNQTTMSLLLGNEVADAMLLQTDGLVLFSLNPAYRRALMNQVPFLASSNLDFSSTELTFNHLNLDNEPFLTSSSVFTTPNRQTYLLYFRVSTAKAQQEKSNILLLLVVGFTAIVVVTSAVIYLFFNRFLFVRINDLVAVMRRVEAGDLSTRAQPPIGAASSYDELAILQNGTNTMIARLQDLVQTLEDRVQARTYDLTVSSEVSRFVTTVLNQKRLLSQLVELTCDSFHFYHVAIFLYDGETETLALAASSGEIGKKRLQMGQSFRLDDHGIVPTAGQKQLAVLSNSVASTQEHLKNPLLPLTRSEIAVPIIFAGDLIGVLDLQSAQENRFTDNDTRLFTSFANQIAVAIRNAGLFEEVLDARERAEKADRVKSAFLASMSHELRTPLNVVINFSKFLRKGHAGPVTEEQSQLLLGVSESGQHLLSLINDVLDMSKIEAGALKLFVETGVDIAGIIASAITYTAPIIGVKPVVIEQQISPELPLITGDRKRLLQILLNVLSNACKFTDEGSIKVVACADEKYIHISVEDSGEGIADADAEGVFTPFKQTASGLRQGGGTGLGMPITRKLIEAHGGEIWFKSELSKGTTFFIKLPVQLPEQEKGDHNGV